MVYILDQGVCALWIWCCGFDRNVVREKKKVYRAQLAFNTICFFFMQLSAPPKLHQGSDIHTVYEMQHQMRLYKWGDALYAAMVRTSMQQRGPLFINSVVGRRPSISTMMNKGPVSLQAAVSSTSPTGAILESATYIRRQDEYRILRTRAKHAIKAWHAETTSSTPIAVKITYGNGEGYTAQHSIPSQVANVSAG